MNASTVLTVDNRSGKWSQPAAHLAQSLLASAQNYADAVLLTEVTEPHQARLLEVLNENGMRVGKGERLEYRALHDLAHGDRDEVAMLFRTDTVRVDAWSTYAVGPDLGPGGRVVAGIADTTVLATGGPCVFATWHSPASVEGDWDGHRARAYRAARYEFRVEINAHRRRLGGWWVPVIVGGDWNLDFHKPWVRDELHARWPRLRVPPLPPAGSHGDRFIDPLLLSGRARVVCRLELLRMSPGNDHRGVRGTIRVGAR